MKVTLRENESVEDLIRRFKKVVLKSNILLDYRKHDYFLKKSLKRKEKSKLNRKKIV